MQVLEGTVSHICFSPEGTTHCRAQLAAKHPLLLPLDLLTVAGFLWSELVCLALVGAAGEPVLLEVCTSHIWACVLTLPYLRLACCCEAQLLHQDSSPSALEAKQ